MRSISATAIKCPPLKQYQPLAGMISMVLKIGLVQFVMTFGAISRVISDLASQRIK